jgi:hypothetical protein
MLDGEVAISIGVDEASDSFGFVGVVNVGDAEAYRTLEAFPTPLEAKRETRDLVGVVLGELLAGAEWRLVHDELERAPTRVDYNMSIFRPNPPAD